MGMSVTRASFFGETMAEPVHLKCCPSREEMAVWLPDEGVITIHGEVFPCTSAEQARKMTRKHAGLPGI